jgi:Predicted metal-dependent hydrolase
MDISVILAGKHYWVKLDGPVSLAIPLDFNGPQPNFFGAPRATATPLKVEGFVGDTQQGGSCNVAALRLIPHCNGTHTESVGHIVNQLVPITEVLHQTLFAARLITITPCAAGQTSERYRPPKQTDDRLITRRLLENSLRDIASVQLKAVLVRTLPNDEPKKSSCYGESCWPPFFSVEAMYYLIRRGVEHLLVDFPSLDRMYDEGRLTVHHLFWNVPERQHELSAETHTFKTVTEMIFVPNQVPDGLYLLNLQIPAFLSDAAPCRPVIYPLETV